MEIRFVEADNAAMLDMMRQLDEYYFSVVGEVHKKYAKYNDPHLLACRAVAYVDGNPAACGGWKAVDGETAEIKRIFVCPAFRRQGVASALITALEQRRGAARPYAPDPRDRAHDRGLGRALSQAGVSGNPLLRQPRGRGKLPVL